MIFSIFQDFLYFAQLLIRQRSIAITDLESERHGSINPSTRVEGLHTIFPTGFQNCYEPVTAAFPILLLS